MGEKIVLVRAWLRYIAACLNWVSSVLALETFPKKSDYFGPNLGPDRKPADSGGAVAPNREDVAGGGAVRDGELHKQPVSHGAQPFRDETSAKA